MTQHITIADVAKAAGVSATTVSRIINGHYDKMRPATRKRVEKAIKGLHFVPTASARQLRQTHSHVVGILLSFFSSITCCLLFFCMYLIPPHSQILYLRYFPVLVISILSH